MKKARSILWGVVLIAIGVVLALNALNITNINIFFDGWWTLFIIVPSAIGLFKQGSKLGNLITLLIGVGLLLACLDIIDFGMLAKLSVPAVLIIIGISLIFKNQIRGKLDEEIKKARETAKEGNDSDDKEYASVFSGQTVSFSGKTFTGAKLSAVFGGIKLDLKDALILSDVVIETEAIFGGITVSLPDNVNIKIKSSAIFGGISSKKDSKQNPDVPTVYVKSDCLFGGVTVL